MLFANWRGFSGGQKDMFEEVLKFGAYIVDALRDFRQPVMVYLPPHATLRGGAWVVVDQTINEQFMEMYADDSARGGVLETEGTLDVKFRKKDVIAMAHRLDDKLQALDKELAALETGAAGAKDAGVTVAAAASAAASPSSSSSSSSSSGPRAKDVVLKEMRARETLLFPTYHQVATQFADLHDTPGRMLAKGCIQAKVSWAASREFFYWRLQRRLAETKWTKRIAAVIDECAAPIRSSDASSSSGAAVATPAESWREASALLQSWVDPSVRASAGAGNDRAAAEWFAAHESSTIAASFAAFKGARLMQRMQQLIAADAPAGSAAGSGSSAPEEDPTVGGLASIIGALSAEQKAALKKIFA